MSVLLLSFFAAPALAQQSPPARPVDLPVLREPADSDSHPARLLTLETARVQRRGEGTIGLGDSRLGLVDRRFEIFTNTLHDVIGVANVGVKVGVLAFEEWTPAVAVGGEAYASYGGLLDEGVREIAESFSDVTDASTDLAGWNGWVTASWQAVGSAATNVHLSLQHSDPTETSFSVADSVAGGSGTITFENGEDWSLVWGIDHPLVGSAVVALAEAGYSWGLDRPRFGVGVDAGGRRWRIAAGVTTPGLETDVATDPRDFPLTPTFSAHVRF